MKQIRAYRFRLYPNQEQEQRLSETLETCRRIYNSALAERIAAYRNEGRTLTYVEQAHALVVSKNDWQKRVHSQVLQDALRRLDDAYRRFFKARKTGKAHGFPRFKVPCRYNSFCYPYAGFRLLQEQGVLSLSKIGNVRVRCHRAIDGSIKTCTLVKDVDQWFVVLTVAVETDRPSAQLLDAVIGVDVGIENFATLSTGEVIKNARHVARSEKQIARHQRKLSRKKAGSRNREKARVRLARLYRRVRRRRDDFVHKASHRLATTYGMIVFEKLNIGGMVRSRRMSKQIEDAAWHRFIRYTTYKAESAGGCVELVNPRGTSQHCSGCGQSVPKGLSTRMHSCPSCGLVLHRDHNAAINIANLRAAGTVVPASGGCVRPTA